MLVVVIFNVLISLVCWVVAAKLLGCRPQLKMLTVALDRATINIEQLPLTSLVLAEQQLQFLQFRQTYQNQTVQVDQLRELLRLVRWLTR
jgi:hypothetical protein